MTEPTVPKVGTIVPEMGTLRNTEGASGPSEVPVTPPRSDAVAAWRALPWNPVDGCPCYICKLRVAGDALAAEVERLERERDEARRAAEHERGRVKLSCVYPNTPTVFPWEIQR